MGISVSLPLHPPPMLVKMFARRLLRQLGESCALSTEPWLPSPSHGAGGDAQTPPQLPGGARQKPAPRSSEEQRDKSYLFQGWRILDFHSCDVEPRPFILAKYKRMEQFIFICEAALPQQQTPQLRCYGRVTPNPQSIAIGVFFYGGKMFTVRMPNSSEEVNRWVNPACLPESKRTLPSPGAPSAATAGSRRAAPVPRGLLRNVSGHERYQRRLSQNEKRRERRDAAAGARH